MQDVVISAKGLTKRYSKKGRGSITSLLSAFAKGSSPASAGRDFYALNDVSFEIRRGEIVGIIGHNGAGKSTLLKLLSRITAPTSGYAKINGRVGMLLEVGTGFHPDLTGRENVFLGGAILGMSKEETLAKYQDIVDFAEIHDFMDMQVRHYSSGMNLRLALAVAIHLEADIIFLDEVWAVGDQAFQQKSLARIEEMIKSGRTFLIVSHSEETIRRLCDRCIMLDHGRVIIDGTPEQAFSVYNEYLFKKKISISPVVSGWSVDICRSCGTGLPSADRLTAAVPITNAFSEDGACDSHALEMVSCPGCGLVQLSRGPTIDAICPTLPWIRYNEPGGHLGEVASVLTEALAKAPEGRVVGVGPFDGPLLMHLQAHGVDTAELKLMPENTGQAGRYPYLETIQSALSGEPLRQALSQQGPMAAIVCRYLLEHCHDPMTALRQMRDGLQDDGLLVIEVPDCMKFLQRKDYSFLWEEHISYFTEVSLRSLLGRAGLDVVNVLRTEGSLEDSLVAVCRKGTGDALEPVFDFAGLSAFAGYQRDFIALREAWRKSLTVLAGDRKVAVFGAGHQAIMFINLMGLQDLVAYLVDDASDKVGMIPPGLTQGIVSSSVLDADSEIGVCLLAVNPAVHAKVSEKLTGFRSRGGVILSLFPMWQGDTPLELAPETLTRRSSEVFLAAQPVSAQGHRDVQFLKTAVLMAPRDRVRINLHADGSDPLHEMLIAIRNTSYIRPHKHPGKSESFHIVEGCVDVVIFDDNGLVTDVVSLDSAGVAGGVTYRMSKPLFHTLLIHSDILIVHEITNGPFVPNGAIFADFSPDDGDKQGIAAFMGKVRQDAEVFKESRK